MVGVVLTEEQLEDKPFFRPKSGHNISAFFLLDETAIDPNEQLQVEEIQLVKQVIEMRGSITTNERVQREKLFLAELFPGTEHFL